MMDSIEKRIKYSKFAMIAWIVFIFLLFISMIIITYFAGAGASKIPFTIIIFACIIIVNIHQVGYHILKSIQDNK